MGVTIEELNNKYKVEDSNWDFALFTQWLEKYKIPNTADDPVIAETLKRVLIQYTPETLPERHHDFDRSVLALAQELIGKLNIAKMEVLERNAQDALRKYDADWYGKGRTRKIWAVLRGHD